MVDITTKLERDYRATIFLLAEDLVATQKLKNEALQIALPSVWMEYYCPCLFQLFGASGHQKLLRTAKRSAFQSASIKFVWLKTIQNQHKHIIGWVVAIVVIWHFLHPESYGHFYLPPHVILMILRFSTQPDSPYSQILRKAGLEKAEPNRPLAAGDSAPWSSPPLRFVLKEVKITTVGEKSGAGDELGVLLRSVTHPPHRRRGQPAVVEVNVVAVIVPWPWPFNHVATSRNSSPVTVVAPQPVSATVTRTNNSPPFSGRHHAIFELDAIALGSYKLSVSSAPLGSQAPNPSTRASNHPPELANLKLPPNRSRAPQGVTSPWPTHYRSVLGFLALVSVSLCAVDA
jgi:hypothetical protein